MLYLINMKINQDKVPSTILQAVDELYASLSEEDKQQIKTTDDVRYHHGSGRFVRNSWSLWDNKTKLVQDAIKTYKIAHADDISGLIFEWVFAKVRCVDFDPFEHVEIYHKHWRNYGKTSLQAGGVEE